MVNITPRAKPWDYLGRKIEMRKGKFEARKQAKIRKGQLKWERRATRWAKREHVMTDIKGIGPARAGQLEEIGIKTVKDLARASPEEISEKIGVPAKESSKWIEEASRMAK